VPDADRRQDLGLQAEGDVQGDDGRRRQGARGEILKPIVAALALVVATATTPAYALSVPAKPTGPVNDYAHLLSADAVKRLTDQLLSYEQGTTRQIAVAIFPTLEDPTTTEDRFDFSMRVAEAWKIGGKKNSDGVLITVFVKEHQDQILVGYGLEGQLTDALSLRIRTELMEPRFKTGDFEGG